MHPDDSRNLIHMAHMPTGAKIVEKEPPTTQGLNLQGRRWNSVVGVAKGLFRDSGPALKDPLRAFNASKGSFETSDMP
jgi:hypothetical protein